MIGKKFTSLTDGRIVEIKDVFEDIVILTDGSKTKTSRIFDKNYFEEYIDPRSFFSNQNLLESFAQKIKQIPDEVLNKMQDTNNQETIKSGGTDFEPRFNESAVLPADPEFEKEELMRKYGIKNSSVQVEPPFVQAQKQLEQFKSLLQEMDDEEERVESIVVNRDEEDIVEDYKVIEQKVDQKSETVIKKEVDDPIITMFKNVKRNTDFTITLDIRNKIPRSDFIEMMEDSYNTSIIEFLADEFTNQLLSNPDIIKNKIIDEIKKIVYPKSETAKIEPTETKIPKITKSRATTRQKKKEVSND